MTAGEFEKMIARAACRVVGADDVAGDLHREVVAVLAQSFDEPDTTILCEPSLAGRSHRPPDLVLISPALGVHVIEVKQVSLDQVEAIEPGGKLKIRYSQGVSVKCPVSQARTAMFDIKDATQRACAEELTVPFRYWAVFPQISRTDWSNRWGEDGFMPRELLFSDDLYASSFPGRLAGGIGAGQVCTGAQMNAIGRAFGDSSVLYPLPGEREPRRVAEGTLGERFDEAAEAYRALSDEQQARSAEDWSGGPRLIRGVAGSGKTVVLANNLVRRLLRLQREAEGLFETGEAPPRLLALCFNRSLAPFIRRKIDVAHQQRTGRSLPGSAVDVFSYNRLLWHLADQQLWAYQRVDDAPDDQRAARYLEQLREVKARQPELLASLGYRSIYIDEGQDFCEEDFRLLRELAITPEGREPEVYVFYDDAQNLYGRGRPNWLSLGLEVRGRSHVMTECFRNTRQIVEAGFNVLYGTAAEENGRVPTRDFGDIRTLEQKQLIGREDGMWRVRFARREGESPIVTHCGDAAAETEQVIRRLRWLIGEQQVRPEDILVLAAYRERAQRIAAAVGEAEVAEVHLATREKDQRIGRRGRLTVSTVASAKGYDAYCVLLVSANEFRNDVHGRASFYVGCTRAIEYLELFGYARSGLLAEAERAIERLGPPRP